MKLRINGKTSSEAKNDSMLENWNDDYSFQGEQEVFFEWSWD